MNFQQGDWVLLCGIIYRVKSSNPIFTMISNGMIKHSITTKILIKHQRPWVKTMPRGVWLTLHGVF